jgi:hypothetical protein
MIRRPVFGAFTELTTPSREVSFSHRKFNRSIGIFEGSDTFKGKPILVRFTWTLNPEAAQVAAPWEQALNPKGL